MHPFELSGRLRIKTNDQTVPDELQKSHIWFLCYVRFKSFGNIGLAIQSDVI